MTMIKGHRTTEPFNSVLPRICGKPDGMVSPASSLEYRPVVKATNANTDETTTIAINTIAVSKLVMPRWSRHQVMRHIGDLKSRTEINAAVKDSDRDFTGVILS